MTSVLEIRGYFSISFPTLVVIFGFVHSFILVTRYSPKLLAYYLFVLFFGFAVESLAMIVLHDYQLVSDIGVGKFIANRVLMMCIAGTVLLWQIYRNQNGSIFDEYKKVINEKGVKIDFNDKAQAKIANIVISIVCLYIIMSIILNWPVRL